METSFWASPSFRRILVALITPALVLFKDKLGVEVSQESIDWLIGLAITYITTSNLNSAVKAKAEAAGKAASDTVTDKDIATQELQKAIEKAKALQEGGK